MAHILLWILCLYHQPKKSKKYYTLSPQATHTLLSCVSNGSTPSMRHQRSLNPDDAFSRLRLCFFDMNIAKNDVTSRCEIYTWMLRRRARSWSCHVWAGKGTIKATKYISCTDQYDWTLFRTLGRRALLSDILGSCLRPFLWNAYRTIGMASHCKVNTWILVVGLLPLVRIGTELKIWLTP